MLYFPGLCGQARDAERDEGSCGEFQMGTQHGERGGQAGGTSSGDFIVGLLYFLLCQIWGKLAIK